MRAQIVQDGKICLRRGEKGRWAEIGDVCAWDLEESAFLMSFFRRKRTEEGS